MTAGRSGPKNNIAGCAETVSPTGVVPPCTGPSTPGWLHMDLQKPTIINRIQALPAWDRNLYYQFTIEVLTDRASWTKAANMSDNTRPARRKGDMHTFEPMKARYLRVNMLHNSANPSVHLSWRWVSFRHGKTTDQLTPDPASGPHYRKIAKYPRIHSPKGQQ